MSKINSKSINCPVCERPAVRICRCLHGDRMCENGHNWYTDHGKPKPESSQFKPKIESKADITQDLITINPDSQSKLQKDDPLNIQNETELKDRLQKILSDEAPDFGTIDGLPFIFHGITTTSFGDSRLNPFYRLRDVAIDPKNSWSDRTNSVRYMMRIPHVNRDKECIACTISIVSDHQYPLRDRFHFFSNNESIIKLDYPIVNALHRYVYENFNSLIPNGNPPLIYRILSAQYILTQFPIGSYDIEGVQEWLLSVCNNPDSSVQYIAECADILERAGYNKYKTLGREFITRLGELYIANNKRTIYTNLQNVHDETVTQSVTETLRYLIENIVPSITLNTSVIHEELLRELRDVSEEKRDRVLNSFTRILIDTGKYEGLVLSDILLLVWTRIQQSPHQKTMMIRLIDELDEMDATCSSGHLSRLINVLSGFTELQPVKISFEEQLKNNVFARYTTYLKSLTESEQEIIIAEMTQPDKPNIEQFIFSYSPRDELLDEFVPKYLSRDIFDRVYFNSERQFFGVSL